MSHLPPLRRRADHQVRVRDQRRYYLLGHPLLFSVASAALVGGIFLLCYPDGLAASSIGLAAPGRLEIAWAGCYAIGGAMVICGMLRLQPTVEASGLCLLAGAYAGYSAAIFYSRGFGPGASGATVFAGLCIGCVVRAWLLMFDQGDRPWHRRSS